MNRWYQIRRLRGAVVLILIGTLALLHQWDILRLHQSWPLILIVFGLLMLAERAAWVADVRQQQAAQGFVPGIAEHTPDQSSPPGATDSAWTTPSRPTGDTGAGSFIQSHPPAPEDFGREDR
ncbi:MAG TPA: DUF5668 domain-containing protein [Acidobacteriaceae bacterium]|nr:DUF5668 domain-containing protein [Terriglobia bacterium]HVC91997.1 DUF5668 domain-containing protein [Acidobacteriaceae bacterium]